MAGGILDNIVFSRKSFADLKEKNENGWLKVKGFPLKSFSTIPVRSMVQGTFTEKK